MSHKRLPPTLANIYLGWTHLVRQLRPSPIERGFRTVYGLAYLAPGETMHLSIRAQAGDNYAASLRASASAFARRTDRTIVVNVISARQQAGRGIWQELQVTRLD
jgi:hypothetical protein